MLAMADGAMPAWALLAALESRRATASKIVAQATPICRKTTSGSRTTISPTLACCGLSAVASYGSSQTGPLAHRVRTAMATPPTSMRGVRTRYPRFDPQRGKLINLEQQINRCRTEHMHAPSYPYESDTLLALTTFVAFQSRGLPIDVRIDGPAQPFFEPARCCISSGAASSTSPVPTATSAMPDSGCVAMSSARARPMAFRSTATPGRPWAPRTACLPGVIPPCGPSPILSAQTHMSIWNCSLPGVAVACPSKRLLYGAE